jgi:sensor histidine kinase YesM
VEDNGAGIPALFTPTNPESATPTEFYGIGLRNVAARLNQLYQRADLLSLESTPAGTIARLTLPLDSPDAEDPDR